MGLKAFASVSSPGSETGWRTRSSRNSTADPRRILFHTAPWAMQYPGGGEVQLVETARHLKRLGAPVQLFDPWNDRIEPGDCVHLFGTVAEHLPLARAAKQRGAIVALSTISWYDP